jgi:hypothetical protein
MSPPPCFMTGENVRSFRTFANELFLSRPDHMLKSADVFEAITLYFPCFDFTRKELIKYLEELPVEYGIQYLKDQRVGRSKGAFVNVAFNIDNLQRLKDHQPLLREDGSESPTFVL